MNIAEYASRYVGVQETAGPNRGPLVDKWKGMVSKPLATRAIPWCGCFVFAMLAELNNLNRNQLAARLGFSKGAWYPESCDSWLQQAREANRIVVAPLPGDLFLLMKKFADGRFSTTDATHIGFFTGGVVSPGANFNTLEGNTVPQGDGVSSREGNAVAIRTRRMVTNGFLFIRVPRELTGYVAPDGGAPLRG